jgi:hypothetical protein
MSRHYGQMLTPLRINCKCSTYWTYLLNLPANVSMPPRLAYTAIAISFSSIFLSCNKNQGSPISFATINHLQYDAEYVVKIGQAINFYDRTALNDSLSYVQPPTERYYEWAVLPDNGCVTFWGDFKHGKPDVKFNCPGRYQIFGSLFDSASQTQIGKTDTLIIDVNNDTLRSSQTVKANDELSVTASLSKTWYDVQPSDPFPPTRPADEVSIALGLETNEGYEYNSYCIEIPVESSISNNNYSYIFSDSVKLITYPFAVGLGLFNKIQEGITIRGLQFGVPADLSIAWLRKIYTGKITLLSEDEFVVEWDNSGTVKFKLLINGSLTEK